MRERNEGQLSELKHRLGRTAIRAACLGSLLASTGCSSPQAVSPPNPQVTGALEKTGRTTVLVVDGPGTPLIVDWNPEQRTDLEVAMREGVAVVKYDGGSLSLLPDCRIDGSYGFIGVTTKKQVIQLESEQEVRANLPLAGPGLVAKLGGELGQGSTVDVAMVIVGKSRTTWISPTSGDLHGRCEGATHFVRGATVGASVLDAGTTSTVRSAAQIFDLGLSGGSDKSSDMRNQDGSLEACAAARPEANKPPPQCAALIRLELNPIVEGGANAIADGGKANEKPVTVEATCPEGMVMTAGKCAAQSGAQAYRCDGSDLVECQAQCEKGEGDSCDIAGSLLFHDDKSQFASLTAEACRLGSVNGCFNYGVALYNGFGTNTDKKAAFEKFKASCQEGMAIGCENVGYQYFLGEGVGADTSRAALYYRSACDGGAQGACINLGVLYMGGDGVPNDPAKALGLFKRACEGGDAIACGNVGLYVEFGMGVRQDPGLAVKLFERACQLDSGSCTRLAIAYQAGFGVARNDEKARKLFTRSCTSLGGGPLHALACSMLNLLYEETRTVDRQALSQLVPVMKPQCTQAVARACGFLGAAYLAMGDETAATAYLRNACQLKDYWACDIEKRIAKP